MEAHGEMAQEQRQNALLAGDSSSHPKLASLNLRRHGEEGEPVGQKECPKPTALVREMCL